MQCHAFITGPCLGTDDEDSLSLDGRVPEEMPVDAVDGLLAVVALQFPVPKLLPHLAHRDLRPS